jgi:hypothetical protein
VGFDFAGRIVRTTYARSSSLSRFGKVETHALWYLSFAVVVSGKVTRPCLSNLRSGSVNLSRGLLLVDWPACQLHLLLSLIADMRAFWQWRVAGSLAVFVRSHM